MIAFRRSQTVLVGAVALLLTLLALNNLTDYGSDSLSNKKKRAVRAAEYAP